MSSKEIYVSTDWYHRAKIKELSAASSHSRLVRRSC